MRRITVVLGSLALVAATSAAAPAEAAAYSLSVTTISRTGHAVSSTVVAHNMTSNQDYTLRSGHRRTLPRGRYAILSRITTISQGTDWTTLAAHMTTVKDKTTLRLDARKAHTLKISLSGDSTSQQSAAVCVGPFPSTNISVSTAAGHLSLLPATSTALHFQYATSWTSAVGEPPFYFVGGAAKGVPANPAYTFWRSHLATLNLTVRKGTDPSPNTWLEMVPRSANGCNGSQSGVVSAGGYSFAAPTTLAAHVSAGTWDTWVDYRSQARSGNRTYVGGRTYSLTFNRN
jgi:hypothetical protein